MRGFRRSPHALLLGLFAMLVLLQGVGYGYGRAAVQGHLDAAGWLVLGVIAAMFVIGAGLCLRVLAHAEPKTR